MRSSGWNPWSVSSDARPGSRSPCTRSLDQDHRPRARGSSRSLADHADSGVVGENPDALCPGRELPPAVPQVLLSFGDGHHRYLGPPRWRWPSSCSGLAPDVGGRPALGALEPGLAGL